MPSQQPCLDESADSATNLLESPSNPTESQLVNAGRQPAPPPVVIVSSRSNTLNSSVINNLLFAGSGSSSGARAIRRSRNRARRSRRNHHLSNHVTLMNHHLSQHHHHHHTASSSSSSGHTASGSSTAPSSCTYAFSLSTSPTCFSLLNANKKSERNLFSACCAVFCVAVLAVSLVETRWFYLNGGGCNLSHIGVADFFAPGRLEVQFEPSKVEKTQIPVYSFILPNGAVLKNCTNREILLIMRTIIAFVFLAIFSSCVGLMLDTIGCMKSSMKVVRRHGIFHILTVLLCLTVSGFCFWISERMYDQQHMTRAKKGKKVEVSFDVSYYLIVLASMLSILATAFTLIKRYPSDEDEQLERLLEEYTGFEEPLHLERSLPAAPPSTLNRPTSYFDTLNESSSSSAAAARGFSHQLPSSAHSFSVQPFSNAEDANAGNQQSADLYDYANSSDLVQFNQPARLSTLSRISLLPSLLQHSQQQQQPQSNELHPRNNHQQQAPPPPLTPPPSLHSNMVMLNQMSSRPSEADQVGSNDDANDNYYQLQAPLADPPPPYDPTPVIA